MNSPGRRGLNECEVVACGAEESRGGNEMSWSESLWE